MSPKISTLISPAYGWEREKVQPPTVAYVTGEDYLAAMVYTTASTAGLRLAYRLLDAEGTTHLGVETLDGAPTSTVTTKIFRMGEGFLLSVVASNIGGGLADQTCFVSIGLQRGNQANTPPHTVIAQGYVSNVLTVNWPPSLARGPATGLSIVGTDLGGSPVTLTTTAETVVLVGPTVNALAQNTRCFTLASVQVATGTGVTSLQMRIRAGTTIAGALIGQMYTSSAYAVSIQIAEMIMVSQAVAAAGAIQNCLTVQQVAATGNGSATAATILGLCS